jgi:hypothetical protein
VSANLLAPAVEDRLGFLVALHDLQHRAEEPRLAFALGDVNVGIGAAGLGLGDVVLGERERAPEEIEPPFGGVAVGDRSCLDGVVPSQSKRRLAERAQPPALLRPMAQRGGGHPRPT